MWVAFSEAVIRFWNNRFAHIDEQVSYLRLQLEKEKELNTELIETIKMMALNEKAVTQDELPQTETQPIRYKKPWHVVRQELEQKSRDEAIRLDREARTEIEREKAKGKTVEQLEEELLNGSE